MKILQQLQLKCLFKCCCCKRKISFDFFLPSSLQLPFPLLIPVSLPPSSPLSHHPPLPPSLYLSLHQSLFLTLSMLHSPFLPPPPFLPPLCLSVTFQNNYHCHLSSALFDSKRAVVLAHLVISLGIVKSFIVHVTKFEEKNSSR